jgi:acyl carrier protein phosphodiesterase
LVSRHLTETGTAYFAHMRAAFRVGARLMGASLAAFVHGLIPGWFTRKASETIMVLHAELAKTAKRIDC